MQTSPTTRTGSEAGADAFAHLRATAAYRRLQDVFAGRSILITGGTGFVGRWLLDALDALTADAPAPPTVTVLARRAAPIATLASRHRLRIEPRVTDIRAFDRDRSRWDFVIHAANDTGPSVTGDPGEAISIIVEGTRRLLDQVAAAGCESLLLVGSGAVYGELPPGRSAFAETDFGPFDPAVAGNAYAGAKRLAETLGAIAAGRSGLGVRIARGFSFGGEYLPADDRRAFGSLARAAATSGGPLLLRGNGRPVRSYMYGADMAIWLLTILVAARPMTPYNVGSDAALSLADLARRIARCVRPAATIEFGDDASIGAGDRYVPDLAAARTDLGLEVWTGLDETILRTARYYRGLPSGDQ